MKTVKMSTRKGNVILANDVIDRAIGEAILITMTSKGENRDKMVLMVGKIVRKIGEATKNGEKKVIYNLEEDWE